MPTLKREQFAAGLNAMREKFREDRLAKQRTSDGELHEFFKFKPFPPGSRCIGWEGSEDPPMDQAAFLTSEADVQGFFAANRAGKSRAGDQKEMIEIRGRDPLRPNWRAPVLKEPGLCWHIVDPKKTRDALRDMVRLVPPDMAHKPFHAKGEERIEFAPTELRPHGYVLRILSNMLPRTEYQRDNVRFLRYDEIPRNEIIDECDQRTLSCRGKTVYTATVLAESKAIVKLFENDFRATSPKYRCAQFGPLAWFTASQYANPLLHFSEIEKRAKKLSPEMRKIRVGGEVLLLEGSPFFSGKAIDWIANNDRRLPEFSVNFYGSGIPEIAAWDGEPYSNYWSMWAEPEPIYSYAIGADIAQGLGDTNEDCDFSAAYVYCVQTSEIVARFHSNLIKPIDFAQELMFAARYYNDAVIAPESNAGYGSTVVDQLQKMSYPRIYRRETFSGKMDRSTECFGWLSTPASKHNAANELQLAIANRMSGEPGGITVHDEELLTELTQFGILKERRPGSYGLGALDGHDDLVMALAITLQAAKQAPEPDWGGRRTFSFTNVFDQWKQDALNRKMGVDSMEGGGSDDG